MVVLLSEYIFCAPYFISSKEVYLTIFLFHWHYLTSIYLFKLNNRNTRTTLETCSKLTVKTPVRRQSRRSGVFNVNFEQFSYILEPHCWLWTSKSHVFLYYWHVFRRRHNLNVLFCWIWVMEQYVIVMKKELG